MSAFGGFKKPVVKKIMNKGNISDKWRYYYRNAFLWVLAV